MKLFVRLEKSLTFSGYPLEGRTKFQGMDISIENKVGSTRSGVDADGHEWHTKMKFPYGYIRGTVGVDGDHVDCYLGPNTNSDLVYVIHQIDPDSGAFDEDKVMLGFNSAQDAKKAYLSHYDRPDFFGSMERFSVGEFKALAFSRHAKKITRDRLKNLHIIVAAARPIKKAIDRTGLQLLPTYSGGHVVYRWQNPNKESEINSSGAKRKKDLEALRHDQKQTKMFDGQDAGLNQFQDTYKKVFQLRVKPVLETISKIEPSLTSNFQRKYQNYKFDEETLDMDLKLDEMTAEYMARVKKESSGKGKNQGLFGQSDEDNDSTWEEFLSKSKRLAQEINARKRGAMRIVDGSQVQTPFGPGVVSGFTGRGYPKVVIKGIEKSMFYDELIPEHEAKIMNQKKVGVA